jgi:hypothetical protein
VGAIGIAVMSALFRVTFFVFPWVQIAAPQVRDEAFSLLDTVKRLEK